MTRFSVSFDGERYDGDHGTFEEAYSVGELSARRFWVGECEPPSQPEDLWDAGDWLEHVSCQDEYSNDWAEDWDASTKSQREELNILVRSVLASWLDCHDLRPSFYNIVNDIEFSERGVPVVNGVEVTISQYHMALVLMDLEDLKRQGLIDGDLVVNATFFREVIKAGRLMKYADPDKEQVQGIVSAIQDSCTSTAEQ